MEHDGISFLFVVGKPILRPRIELVSTHFRFSWLFFGIWVFSFDMETFFKIVLNKIDNKDNIKEFLNGK